MFDLLNPSGNIFNTEPIIFQSGASSGAEAGESDDGTSAKEDRRKPTKAASKVRRRRIRKSSVPEILSPPKPRKPPFTIESAMTSIFKRKKSKNEIEDVVIEKVIAEPDMPEPQQQQQQQQSAQQQQESQQQQQVESQSDKKADAKSSGKTLKGRFLFSLSRPSKRDDPADLSNGKGVTPMVTENVDRDVTSNHVTNGDAKSETKKSRWSRRTKASPPPPPPAAVTTVTKANGITVKGQAPQPPVMSSPEPLPPPPLAPKGLKAPIPVSASMTSLRNAIPNGVTPNGRQSSQPATPTTEKRSELVTKLRQSEDTDASQRDAKMLLRSGLEPGTEDINLTELGHDDDAGIQDEKAKRKNPQVKL